MEIFDEWRSIWQREPSERQSCTDQSFSCNLESWRCLRGCLRDVRWLVRVRSLPGRAVNHCKHCRLLVLVGGAGKKYTTAYLHATHHAIQRHSMGRVCEQHFQHRNLGRRFSRPMTKSTLASHCVGILWAHFVLWILCCFRQTWYGLCTFCSIMFLLWWMLSEKQN